MRLRLWSILVLAGCAGVARLSYPPTPREPVVEVLHGVRVEDPYRWLEQDPRRSPRVQRWIAAQNRLTESFLAAVPARQELRRRLTELWNYERFGVPFRRGGRYFYTRNDGLQNQSVLYVAARVRGPGRVLLDPNRLSPDGTVALTGMAVSRDGKLLAYALSSGGSDWKEWRVREVASGRDLPDRIRWSKFSRAAWTPDGKGFFYSRYDAPRPGEELKAANYFQKLYYHRVGTAQEEDLLVHRDPDHPAYGFDGFVSDDGRYLCIHVWRGTARENLFYVKPLERLEAPPLKVVDTFRAAYEYVTNEGPRFWFLTTAGAPRGRVVCLDVRAPGEVEEIVPEAPETLQAAHRVGERLFLVYLKDAHTEVRLFTLAGKFVKVLALPGLGTARGFTGRPEDRETFFAFTSFARPATIYRYDLDRDRSEAIHAPKVRFDPEAYLTRQVFYRSQDGTRVPMFLCHKKGLVPDGDTPTLLYGYGGFNISLTPRFSVMSLVWMELGGLYAQPSLRGGGEYGEAWHRAGMRAKKQNVFDDFIAAAEWLIQNGYTRPGRLAIAGGSNGGLLVGACMTQRPELFGACLPAVGVLDMLRFHKFTIGHAWTNEYGSPEDPQDFRVLLAYSPYHNLRPGVRYPATLITTGDHDDRVYPAHSFKFAARLQRCQAGAAPVLIRIETRAGHGAGKPTRLRIEEAADRLAFLVRVLSVRWPAPASN